MVIELTCFYDTGVIGGIPAVIVVDVAVVVVVDAVGGDLVVVDPEVGGEVFVVGIDAVVDDGDDDGVSVDGNAAGSYVPGGLDVVVRANYAVELAQVDVVPLVIVPRVVGRCALADEVVALEVHHGGVRPVLPAELGFGMDIKVVRQQPGIEASAQRLERCQFRHCRQPVLCIYVRAQLNDQLALAVVELLRRKGKGKKGKGRKEKQKGNKAHEIVLIAKSTTTTTLIRSVVPRCLCL